MYQRYCLELAYRGTRYHGFQSQKNAHTIQAEVEKALHIFYRAPIALTGASRTDTGVHALQNFFHFDTALAIRSKDIYHLNAILPEDIVINGLFQVDPDFHVRFQADARQYQYAIHLTKNPFLQELSYFYPYTLQQEKMQEAAGIILQTTDFTSFAKRGSDQKSNQCIIQASEWSFQNNRIYYQVRANRFLRGMVRGLTATMLAVGRERLSLQQFEDIVAAKDATRADFAVPPHGLYLQEVHYPPGVFRRLSE